MSIQPFIWTFTGIGTVPYIRSVTHSKEVRTCVRTTWIDIFFTNIFSSHVSIDLRSEGSLKYFLHFLLCISHHIDRTSIVEGKVYNTVTKIKRERMTGFLLLLSKDSISEDVNFRFLCLDVQLCFGWDQDKNIKLKCESEEPFPLLSIRFAIQNYLSLFGFCMSWDLR